MHQLLWVIDSPFSRTIKWLLLNNQIEHSEYLLTWSSLATDTLLAEHNKKQQVPVLITADDSLTDSLLIALRFLPEHWHRSVDARLFRLGDCDFEATLIFLFRANALAKNFGESRESAFMREAGVNSYRKNVDVLLDDLLADQAQPDVNVGLVLVQSMLMICRAICDASEVRNYRLPELHRINDCLASDPSYQDLAGRYTGQPSQHWPFFLES